MRTLVWIFIASAVLVGVQIVWLVFIRNEDDYNAVEQEAITRQTLALIFAFVLAQFRQGYGSALTTSHLLALFGYDLMWGAVCLFAGWSAVQYRVFVLLDVIKANFRRSDWSNQAQFSVWLGYLVIGLVLMLWGYLWIVFRVQWDIVTGAGL